MTAPTPPPVPDARRHDLDALRAVAMLLGIVLHAALSFMPGIWPVQDSRQNGMFQPAVAAIHGFRMPLFFVLSGFFTAMLWRRRGLRALLGHRCKRILLPLLLFMVTLIPFQLWVLSKVTANGVAKGGGARQARAAAADKAQFKADLWSAARAGDTHALQTQLGAGTDPNAQQPASGSTALATAAVSGHTPAVAFLLERGADVNARNRDGNTALHGAAFLGHAEVVELLLKNGADAQARSGRGETPFDSSEADWGVTQFIAKLLQIKVDQTAVTTGRIRCRQLLQAHGAIPGKAAVAGPEAKRQQLRGLLQLLINVPVFHHLWFLWFLCWLVAGFAVYAVTLGRFRPGPRWHGLVTSPAALLWLVPLTMIPQWFMGRLLPAFGPDTSLGILPAPPVLMYYAVFFGFGALYYDGRDDSGRLGRQWFLTLPVAVLIVFPVGLDFTQGGLGLRERMANPAWHRLLAVFAQALYAWLMTVGSMGLFRAFLKGESPTMRYLSDSSYWLYVAHLPLIFAMQRLVRDWDLPPTVKFLFICAIDAGFLLLTYRFVVRHSWLGTLLNGRRSRPGATPAAAQPG